MRTGHGCAACYIAKATPESGYIRVMSQREGSLSSGSRGNIHGARGNHCPRPVRREPLPVGAVEKDIQGAKRADSIPLMPLRQAWGATAARASRAPRCSGRADGRL